jgi:hypothetical protein
METKYSYMAGLLDGEGYIGLSKWSGESSQIRYKHKWTYKARLVISNCNLEILEWVKNNFGGYITKKSNKVGCTQGYNLTIGYVDKWLPKVIPYLVGKKKKAELFMEAIELLHQRKKKTNQANELNLERLQEIHLLLRKKEWLI